MLWSVFQPDSLYRSHDKPAAGYQGVKKTLEHLHQQAYWINMSRDVEKHCSECQVCQRSKLPCPTRAPLVSVCAWQMVAVNILEVSVSYKSHCYLLVIQDYKFWADAIPLRNQTPETITQELTKLWIFQKSCILINIGTLTAHCYDRPLSCLESTNHTLLRRQHG